MRALINRPWKNWFLLGSLSRLVCPTSIEGKSNVFWNHGILVEGCAPLGPPGLMKGKVKPLLEESVVKISRRHKKTPAQVLLRHGLQRGIVVIIKSVTPERVKLNFDVFDFELTGEEMEELNKTGLSKRLFVFDSLAKHPEYPFHGEYQLFLLLTSFMAVYLLAWRTPFLSR
ncbi:Aldo-keto reductase family 1 member D1 [Taenia crassiceps]|uniref:Aldo-keto reductase family 1 member D1 n=1 Tax=Taenia crassiceps TaxID=6207 RepID=A0ABR4QAG4_9CEST